MRFRIPELLAARGMSAYALARASDGRVSMSTAYRLKKLGGRVQTFDAALCEALCDVFAVEPGELFLRDKDEAKPAARAKKRPR